VKKVGLTSAPLYGQAGTGDKATLLLDVSVEFPTVGAQYANTENNSSDVDQSYVATNEYIGYYNANVCYSYNDLPLDAPAASNASDYKRFDRVGLAGTTTTTTGAAASNHRCDVTYPNAFSGNFLNWATNSAIDMIRLSLSGGDRLIDTSDLTILQRAVLPSDPAYSNRLDPIFCFWGSEYFPYRRLLKDGGGAGTYWGAVPKSMMTGAGGNDIWISNFLNRIFFGNLENGSCAQPWTANLGSPVSAPAISAAHSSVSSDDIGSYTKCADEGGYCAAFTGTYRMRYGSPDNGGHWKAFAAKDLPKQYCDIYITGDHVPSPVPGMSSTSTPSCYISVLPTTDAVNPPLGTQLNSDGFFYSRVKVCEKDSSGNLIDVRDFSFCTAYPGGNFKPTGVLQKYSDSVRFGIFGYILDQKPANHIGGVLRAPLKYVGLKTFDITGAENTPSSGNARAEWDAQTGIFSANPEGDSMGVSGVINYLNKFGRLGAVPGTYRRYDPVRELFYESVRYLQGLQPNPRAVSTPPPTAAMADGFPYATTWTDPYGGGRTKDQNYSCSNTNVLVVGDVFTYDFSANPPPDAANNVPDFGTYFNIVNNFETGTVSNYSDGQGTTRQTGNPNAPNTEGVFVAFSIDDATNSDISDYTYWAHTQDIRGAGWTNEPTKQRPGMRVNTFFFDVDQEGLSSGSTDFRTHQNEFFWAAKYGGFNSTGNLNSGVPSNSWGNPFKQQDGTDNNNVWQNPLTPGEANNYYLSGNARGILSSFDTIFSRAATIARTIAGAGITRTRLTAKGSVIYQGIFDTSGWSGDVQANAINVSVTNDVTIASTILWSASAQLKAMSTPSTSRNIVVGNLVANSTSQPTFTDFTWAAIGQNLKDEMNKPSSATASDQSGELRVGYLRGDQTGDGSYFRNRFTKLLGDIVNSNVVYSGAPTTSLNSTTYAGFRSTYLNRTPVVFAGANDGMLHAFNAANGNEVFAYIPSWMGPKLADLTVSTYNSNHQGYVDGQSVVADAEVGSAGTSADWRTVLVSGTGGGGPGVFALDVTDPTSFTASNALWEFTSRDDSDMGNVVGRPQILKFRTSELATTPATYKWFAVVGGGVNNASGTPALFLLDLSKPASAAWTLNSNYYKILFPVDANQAPLLANGLLNFAGVPDFNGVVNQIYTGDLHGNMWKLDFTPYGTGEWNMNSLSAFGAGTSNPYPLYIAQDGSGNPQQITMPPTIIRNFTNKSVYVSFGTGKYLELPDTTSTSPQTFYSVFDNQTTTPDNSTGKSVINGRGRLIAGSLDYGAGTVSIPKFTWGRPMSDSDNAKRSGYYFDYTVSSERQISAMTLSGSTLVFGSLIPAAPSGGTICGTNVVGGNEYHLNVDNGSGTFTPSTVGVLGQPISTDLDGATTSTISDNTGKRFRTTKNLVINQGSAGVAMSSIANTTIVTAGRLSWRRINNYQDLKNSP